MSRTEDVVLDVVEDDVLDVVEDVVLDGEDNILGPRHSERRPRHRERP